MYILCPPILESKDSQELLLLVVSPYSVDGDHSWSVVNHSFSVDAGFLLEPGWRDLYSAISICVSATSHEAV